ncbi:hypothetical protein AMAG_02086 [Allomyces macrogynus ATCC 38327]|uniref:1,3-beta-glucan synthase n=1 Tax=Allomyces macrogynus (strain ATCC 38327) TaxID=578462 RepID=A0A0L0S0X7_ALLM3|nr:hypothetical protein AMAG_02086 [Allomyces macrogynus ATCC 38327]|eukprot:KNE56252.1 hypothetical protein AMAG_02086 [Allomyces macrogynus ATCC 38327]
MSRSKSLASAGTSHYTLQAAMDENDHDVGSVMNMIIGMDRAEPAATVTAASAAPATYAAPTRPPLRQPTYEPASLQQPLRAPTIPDPRPQWQPAPAPPQPRVVQEPWPPSPPPQQQQQQMESTVQEPWPPSPSPPATQTAHQLHQLPQLSPISPISPSSPSRIALAGPAAAMNGALTRYPSRASRKRSLSRMRNLDRSRLSSSRLSKLLSSQNTQSGHQYSPTKLSPNYAPAGGDPLAAANLGGPSNAHPVPEVEHEPLHVGASVVPIDRGRGTRKNSRKASSHEDLEALGRAPTLVNIDSVGAPASDRGSEREQVSQRRPSKPYSSRSRPTHPSLLRNDSEASFASSVYDDEDTASVRSRRSAISARARSDTRGSYSGPAFITSLRRLTQRSVFGAGNTASPESIISTLVDTASEPDALIDDFSVVDEQRDPEGHERFGTMQDQLARALRPTSNGSQEQQSRTGQQRISPLPSRIAPNDPRPITRELIEDMFIDLQRRFGFQADSVRNQLEYMLTLIDSRVARMSLDLAVASLHAEIIGGENANYRQWYVTTFGPSELGPDPGADPMGTLTQKVVRSRWRKAMKRLTQADRAMQTALWFCIWGEAANVRFMPECLCFLFKLACDHLTLDKALVPSNSSSSSSLSQPAVAPEGAFLDQVITPLYRAYRDQGYKLSENGKLVRQRRDHSNIVGYDDLNDTFRDWDALAALATKGGQRLLDLPASERYWALDQVEWKLRKTYYEKRTPLHLVANFSRILILHLIGLYYMAMGQADYLFPSAIDRARHWSVVACGSAIAVIITMIAKWAEYSFLPKTVKRTAYLAWSESVLLVMLIVNVAPTVLVYWYTGRDLARRGADPVAIGIAIAHLILSVVTSCYLLFVPPAQLFRRPWLLTRQDLVETGFIAHFVPLTPWDHALSVATWGTILFIKFIGGYFYLVRPFSGVLESWWKAAGKCPVDEIMCGPVTYGGMALLVALQTVLYFLDTYLWYMVVLALVSVGLNMVDGISALSMWRETFYKLPNRIVSKLIAVDGGVPLRMKQASSEIWNSIVLAMYKEHLLPAESLPKMLYQIHPNAADQDCVIEPRFFLAHEDSKSKGEFFPTDSEVERRLSYFSQSLCMNVPEPTPVARMPTFSVLIPHYSEKILLSLEDCTEREDKSSRITLLEYLKTLYPDEWDNFQEKAVVQDNGTDEQNDDLLAEDDDDEEARETAEEKMFRAVGYTNPSPSFVLRTRIWTSLRSQTLYRTVSGFMNYNKAIQIRHRAENLHYLFQGVCSEEEIEDEADYVSSRKFRLVVAMQRYQHFDKNDLESVELLFSVFADLAVSYIEEVPSAVESEPPTFYSCLIDGWCNMTASGARQPRFRIRLPGNPILGDGKGDNQNSAIVFTRGEVLQLIDANQDSYLEESLKVANVLSEFELPGDSVHSPYSPRYNRGRAPVAIVGTREHIFSERVGSLADVAAGKEFAFGTLIQRAMTRLGSRLQYGHPDLLNSLYMITRGGVSKAQKGLHLNEDIYAGMNVLSRGGRIKHSEYLQCGKGRDLGFTSVLNFTAKLGSGAGEQVLSRDVWYLGTRLPLDRLLSYYFAHIGFYINAAFVVASVVLFLWTSAMAAVMQARHPGKCTGKDAASTCPTDLATLQDWVSLCVSELIFSLLISFLPLLLQMVNEYGVGRALKRILMQFFSLVSLFEGFAIYVYSSMFWHNLALGGAGYIATGRAVSTARAPFSTLYQRFSRQGISLGVALGMLALLVSTQGFQAALVFYWIFVISYALSPFLFNPNQFVLADFLLDYRVTLRWLFAGHQAPAPRNLSWANLVVADRGRLTGERGGATRARLRVFIVRNLLGDLVVIAFAVGLYGYAHPKFSILDSIIRVAAWPAAMLGVCFAMSAVSLALSLFLGQIPFVARLVPAIGYGLPTLALIAIAWVAWALEGFALPGTLVALFPFAAVLHAIETLVLFFVPPEFDTKGTAHRAFWTGRWHTLGAFAPVYVVRELLVVPFELAWFALDWATIHVLVAALFPVCLVPFVSDVHTLMLLWVRKPKKSDNGAPANGSGDAVADATAKPKHRRRRLRIAGAGLMLAGTLLVLVALVVVPAIVPGPLAKIVAGIAGHLPLHALKAIPIVP